MLATLIVGIAAAAPAGALAERLRQLLPEHQVIAAGDSVSISWETLEQECCAPVANAPLVKVR